MWSKNVFFFRSPSAIHREIECIAKTGFSGFRGFSTFPKEKGGVLRGVLRGFEGGFRVGFGGWF